MNKENVFYFGGANRTKFIDQIYQVSFITFCIVNHLCEL